MTIKFRAKHKSGYLVDALSPFSFPAGEAHLKGTSGFKVEDYEYFVADIRGYDAQDFFHLAMWVDFLDSFETADGSYPIKYLFLPYIPAARADRGAPLGAKVYAQFVNTLFLDKIIVIDPHSPVAQTYYENSEGFPAHNTVEFPFERIIKHSIQDGSSDSGTQPYVGVIAPDKGAHDRAKRAADVMGVPVYTAGKVRDPETGALSGFHMEDELPQEGKFLIVDDICDGGGTFIGLAAAIEKTNPNVELDLWVTHGVFSKGLVLLSHKFGTIHTTNSYTGSVPLLNPMSPVDLVIHDITPHLYNEITMLRNTHV